MNVSQSVFILTKFAQDVIHSTDKINLSRQNDSFHFSSNLLTANLCNKASVDMLTDGRYNIKHFILFYQMVHYFIAWYFSNVQNAVPYSSIVQFFSF